MQIELLGYFIIPLGIILFFLDKKWILYATIFFMGFTGASIVTINNDLSIQPSYYLAMIFIIKHIITIANKKKIVKPNILLCIFIFICIASLIMPSLVQNQNVYVINQDDVNTTVKFTTQNLTQLMYILYCFVFYWMVKDYMNTRPDIVDTSIKVLIYGAIFVCILGIYQEMAYVMNWEFDKIFRSGIHGNIQPYGSFVRIYSTAIEPSMLAYYIAPIFALIICLNKYFIKYKYIVLFLILIIGIGTISTTFFIGIIFFILTALAKLFITQSKQHKSINMKIIKGIAIALCIGVLAIMVIYSLNKDILNVLITTTLDKIAFENDSSIQRSASFSQHLKIGITYPLLGVGFGSARSKDLFSTWLCNIGVIGTGIFIAYIINLLIGLRKINSEKAVGIINFIIIIFICAFTSVSEPYALFIWFGLGVAELLINENYKNCEYKDKNN